MWKKILTMSLVLVMVLSFAACAKEAGEKEAEEKEAEEEVELPSVQEIVDGVIETLDDIRTYQMDMDMTMDMAGEAEGEAFEATTATDSSGALDLENERMRLDLTMNMVAPGEDEMEMAMEIYLIGGMVYMLMESPETGPVWTKSAVIPGWIWAQMNQVEPQIELLESAQVKLIGSEKVRGVDCYVLQLTPDMGQLLQMAMQQPSLALGGAPAATEESLQEMFRSFSVKQWVAKDTYFLTKSEVDMTVDLTPEAMGFPEEEGVMTMNITMNLVVYNHNQPVSIVLPPEAEEAS